MKKFVILISFIAIVIFAFWFIWDGFIKDKTPHFFPINNKDGQYTIIEIEDGILEAKYSGQGIFNNAYTITTMIGKTDYELKKYVNKPIIITKGRFVGGYKQQCIANSCRDIGGPYAVINIEELTEVQK